MSMSSRNFGQWKILLICPDANLGNELAVLLSEFLPYSPVMELKKYPTRSVLQEAMQEHGCNLCFLDAESSRDWALALISDLVLLDPKLPVVAIHGSNDSDYILRTLRQGAVEFLFQPLTAEQFTPVMERIAEKYRSKHGVSGKVVAVVPAKGACGASTLAAGMAQHWKKLGVKKILLADLDPLAGTVSFLMKQKQTYSFMDALARGSQLDEDIWRGLVQTVGTTDVLLAPDQPVHGIDEAHNPAGLIDFARSLYEVVILDTGGPYGVWNNLIARFCDDLVLVTTNELPSLQAAQRCLAYFERNRVDRSKIKVVVNRYRKDLGLSREMVESALHCDVFQLVASDYEEIQRALVEGKAVGTGTAVGKGIVELTEKLWGKKVAPPPAKTGSLASLFGFLRH